MCYGGVITLVFIWDNLTTPKSRRGFTLLLYGVGSSPDWPFVIGSTLLDMVYQLKNRGELLPLIIREKTRYPLWMAEDNWSSVIRSREGRGSALGRASSRFVQTNLVGRWPRHSGTYKSGPLFVEVTAPQRDVQVRPTLCWSDRATAGRTSPAHSLLKSLYVHSLLFWRKKSKAVRATCHRGA
jgi:hypothetical protein